MRELEIAYNNQVTKTKYIHVIKIEKKSPTNS